MPARSRHTSRHGSLFERWDGRISLVFYALMSGFAIAACVAALFGTIVACVAALFGLPSNPDKSWISATAQGLIETGTPPTLMCLVVVAIYLLIPEIRQFVASFRATRLARLAFAILLPSCAAIVAYGIALLQDPALWHRLILVIPLAALAAGITLLIISVFVGYFERKRLLAE